MQIYSIKNNFLTNLGNLTFVLLFVDFLKAFDGINHSMMLKILAAYDITPNILNAIKIVTDSL